MCNIVLTLQKEKLSDTRFNPANFIDYHISFTYLVNIISPRPYVILKIYKRPMGYIAHLGSMNIFERSYDYIYYKIGPLVREEKIVKFRECMYLSLIHI